jgi:hypothetical protein
MAQAPATSTSILNIFKEVYGERIEEQPNREAFMYKEFEKTKKRFGGKYWTFPVLDEGGQAVGSYLEDDVLPQSQAETVLATQITSKKHYAVVRISGFAIKAARRNLYAFIQSKDLEIRNKTKWLISDLNRQCYGESMGELGEVLSDAANQLTFVVGTNMNHFRKGMKIDIFDAALTTKHNGTVDTQGEGRGITVINKATRTITYDGTDLAGSTAATDRVFREDSRSDIAATAEGKELNGLRFIVDDTTTSIDTFQNIDRSSVAIWNGNVLQNSGTLRPLSLDLMQVGVDTGEIESGMRTNRIIGGYGQRRNYLNLLWYDVRYGPQELKGGFQVLKYNDIDFWVDKDASLQTLFFLSRETIQRYEVQALGILDEAGVGAERLPQQDVYEILIGGYFNLGCGQCNANTRMIDLQEP